MRRILTLALSVALGIALFAQRGNQPQPGTIDGSRDPDLIADRMAYSSVMRLLAYLGEENARAYVSQKELGNADALLRAARDYAQAIEPLDSEAQRIKDENWPDPDEESMDRLQVLQREKNELLEQFVSPLLDENKRGLEAMKFKMRLTRAPNKSPRDW